MSAGPSVHANCVVVAERGVLIRGASGAGKSSLSAKLIERARCAGLFSRLVCDDRTFLEAKHGRILASAAPQIAGLIERRGLGVVTVPWLSRAVVRLVVDLASVAERMPEDDVFDIEIKGIKLPRLTIGRAETDAAAIVLSRLTAGFEPGACDPLALAFGRQRGKIARSAT